MRRDYRVVFLDPRTEEELIATVESDSPKEVMEFVAMEMGVVVLGVERNIDIEKRHPTPGHQALEMVYKRMLERM